MYSIVKSSYFLISSTTYKEENKKKGARGTCKINEPTHGLRTLNEGINQRYLKIWADVADKICFGRT